MRSFKVVAIAVVLQVAAPAAAELPASPLGDIYESYNDCLKVAAPSGLKFDVLSSLGWSPATVTTADGKPATGTPTIFANAKRKPVIFLSIEKAGNVCNVMARLENDASFAKFTEAWGGKLPPPDKDGIIGFVDEGHLVALRQTGKPGRPALTISVMTPAENK